MSDVSPMLIAESRLWTTTPELLKLLTFLSPAFPVGSFAYSHGLDWLIVEAGVTSEKQIKHWLVDLLERGSGWNDALLFCDAYRAAVDRDDNRLLGVAELAEARAGSRERQIETTEQGRAFLAAAQAAWPCRAAALLSEENGAPYPVAVASVTADHGISLEIALPAWLSAFAANLVSVAVRLVPLGQTAGLRVLAALHPIIETVSRRALRSDLDDLGSATFRWEIAAMRHEEQYSRVFRT